MRESAAQAGIGPEFWNLTPTEIDEKIKASRYRMKWEATLAYIQVCPLVKDPPSIESVFPGLFEPDQEIPQWKIMQARIAAHANDYKRDRSESH